MINVSPGNGGARTAFIMPAWWKGFRTVAVLPVEAAKRFLGDLIRWFLAGWEEDFEECATAEMIAETEYRDLQRMIIASHAARETIAIMQAREAELERAFNEAACRTAEVEQRIYCANALLAWIEGEPFDAPPADPSKLPPEDRGRHLGP